MIRVYITERDYIEVKANEAKIIDGSLQLYNSVGASLSLLGIFASNRWIGAVKMEDE